MACASFAKLNAASSQWIGQQSFTQRTGSSSSTRFMTRRVSVPIRAGAYTQELVQTAVSSLDLYIIVILSIFIKCFFMSDRFVIIEVIMLDVLLIDRLYLRS